MTPHEQRARDLYYGGRPGFTIAKVAEALARAYDEGFKTGSVCFGCDGQAGGMCRDCHMKALSRVDQEARESERERCAKACDEFLPPLLGTIGDRAGRGDGIRDCAAAIRALGREPEGT